MQRFLARESLNVEQRSVVFDAMSLLTPETYARGANYGETKAKKDDICRRARSLFDSRQKLAFGVIAYDSEVKESQVLSWLRTVKRSATKLYTLNATEVTNECDCAFDTYCPDCSASSGCAAGTGCVIPADEGCGCFNWYYCYGRCIPI